jgi:hypothetical protein
MHPDAGIPPPDDRSPHPTNAKIPASPARTVIDPGLPPVAPPSGKFILQLFLVPGLIVFGIVLLLLAGYLGFGGSDRKLQQILRGLDDPNPEVRWRAGEDLGRVLPGDEHLAQNVSFGLDIAERVQRALKHSEKQEREYEDRLHEASGKLPLPKSLEEERNHVLFLISCLGHFQTPVGAPLLARVAKGKVAGDAEVVFRRRNNALLALINLGSNLGKFDKLLPVRRNELLAHLDEESNGPGERGQWAADALAHLKDRGSKEYQDGRTPDRLGVVAALIKCARDPAPFLRKEAAGALSVWNGPGVEDALVRLLDDNGHGEEPVRRSQEEEEYRKQHTKELQELNRKQVRYNAILALARRNSPRVGKNLNLFEEMLDEDMQQGLCRTAAHDRKPEDYQEEARSLVLIALRTLDRFHQRNPNVDLSPLRTSLDRLADNPHPGVSQKAAELRGKLN